MTGLKASVRRRSEYSVSVMGKCARNLPNPNRDERVAPRGDAKSLTGHLPTRQELCLVAVQEDGYALRDVRDKTPELCLAAVKNDMCALQFMPDSILPYEVWTYLEDRKLEAATIDY